MDTLTRRRFLGWTSAGAAGAGLLALAPRLLDRAPSATPAPVQPPTGGLAEPLVAYVHNAASGTLSLMSGTREITLHDPDLVARLLGGLR
jgi:hypothetical protein